MTDYSEYELATRAVRAGQQRSDEGEHSEAIYPTSSFVFSSAAQAAARFNDADLTGREQNDVPLRDGRKTECLQAPGRGRRCDRLQRLAEHSCERRRDGNHEDEKSNSRPRPAERLHSTDENR